MVKRVVFGQRLFGFVLRGIGLIRGRSGTNAGGPTTVTSEVGRDRNFLRTVCDVVLGRLLVMFKGNGRGSGDYCVLGTVSPLFPFATLPSRVMRTMNSVTGIGDDLNGAHNLCATSGGVLIVEGMI